MQSIVLSVRTLTLTREGAVFLAQKLLVGVKTATQMPVLYVNRVSIKTESRAKTAQV